MADRGKDDQVSRCPLVRRRAALFTRPAAAARRPAPPHNMAGAPGLCCLCCCLPAPARARSRPAGRSTAAPLVVAGANGDRCLRSVLILPGPLVVRAAGGSPTLRGWGPCLGRGHPRVPTSCFARERLPTARVPRFACPAHLRSAATLNRDFRTGLDRGRAKVTAACSLLFFPHVHTARERVGWGSALLRAEKALLRSREPVAKVTRAGLHLAARPAAGRQVVRLRQCSQGSCLSVSRQGTVR